MDDRTFDDPKSAQEWISLVEKGQIRDTDINPRLKTWVDQSNAQDILVPIKLIYLHTFDEVIAALDSAGLKVEKTEIFRTSYLILIQGQKVA
jgi:hypothetical protein